MVVIHLMWVQTRAGTTEKTVYGLCLIGIGCLSQKTDEQYQVESPDSLQTSQVGTWDFGKPGPSK